jgi:hypothetical protein
VWTQQRRRAATTVTPTKNARAESPLGDPLSRAQWRGLFGRLCFN